MRENAFAPVRDRWTRSLLNYLAQVVPRCCPRAGVIDERGEHDDVVYIVTRREVEDATAGEQPERRVVRLPYTSWVGKTILRVATNPRDLNAIERSRRGTITLLPAAFETTLEDRARRSLDFPL